MLRTLCVQSYILLAGFKMGDVCVLILYSTLPFSGARFALAGEMPPSQPGQYEDVLLI